MSTIAPASNYIDDTIASFDPYSFPLAISSKFFDRPYKNFHRKYLKSSLFHCLINATISKLTFQRLIHIHLFVKYPTIKSSIVCQKSHLEMTSLSIGCKTQTIKNFYQNELYFNYRLTN